VGETLLVQQHAPVAQQLHHLVVGGEHMLTTEQRQVLAEAAVPKHRVVHLQVVSLTHHVVLQAVTGSGVHGAGAGIQGDVFSQDDGHLAVVEGVPLDHQEALVSGLDHGILQLGIERHRLVGGQGPGGGGPDHHRQRSLAMISRHRVTACHERLRIHHREAHVDGQGTLVHVVHLGLGQCRSAIGTPVHRLGTLVQMTRLHDAPQGADDVRFLLEVHGEIGILPVAQHQQPLEIGLLFFNLAAGIVTAGLAELCGAHFLPRLAHLFLHLQLDGQAMAIPTGHVRGVVAVQSTALDDNVLEHLVHRMADVDVAIGIGRAVVENELLGMGKSVLGRLSVSL